MTSKRELHMIEIITEEVAMPPLEDRRYQKRPLDSNGRKWDVIDTTNEEVMYKGKFEGASLACHNLNKKHYRDT
jgi:hypothetical protein